ncbi:MAG: hypothetical protein IRY99_05485 [Isosphaeraceae bacterium]|nr:hypothetical protein [Isosphaeraceae bacterium]
MNLVKVRGETYNLDFLVKYVEHTGQREAGVRGGPMQGEPIFVDFRFVELFFLDGSRVTLDAPQSEAFLARYAGGEAVLDLDRIDAEILGPVLVRDTQAGDVILPSNEEVEEVEEAENGPPTS